MRVSWIIIGLVLITVGGIWALQGGSVLPGSFMTGQTRWLLIGVATMIGGVALLVLGARPRRPRSGG